MSSWEGMQDIEQSSGCYFKNMHTVTGSVYSMTMLVITLLC